MQKTAETFSHLKGTMRFAGLATQWLLMLLAAVWGGLKADQWAWNGKAPVFVIALPLLALVILFRNLLIELNKTKDEK